MMREKIKISAITAIIFTLLFNSQIFFSQIVFFKYTNISISILIDYLISFISCFILFYFLSINNLLFLLSTCLFFIAAAIFNYFIYFYHIGTSGQNNLMFLLQANLEEILNFLSIKIITLIISVTILAFFISYKMKSVDNKPWTKKYLTSQTISFLILISLFIFDLQIVTEKILPFNLIDQTGKYILKKKDQKEIDYFSSSYFINNNKDPLDVILVIGESARSDHFQINNYSRETTPNLATNKQIISYNKSYSCANWTHESIPCMLTNSADKKEPSEKPSIITAFKKAGFKTLWLGNQGGFFSLENSFMRIANEAEQVIIPSRAIYQGSQLDEEILPYLDNYLTKEESKYRFIVIHTMGSHYHYESRYPVKYQKFKPICQKKFLSRDITHCSQQEIINSYDNTIIYTDFILSEIIKRFENKNAIILYVSDHGESLGEGGFFLHGTAKRPEQYHIPLIFWYSQDFYKKNKEKVIKLKERKEKISHHKNIFHSLIDISNIKSNIADDKLNLLSEFEMND